METIKTFENIMTLIKASNLNYRLEQTHFSAPINLKNSVIKDRSGTTLELLPLIDFEKLKVLENKNDKLLMSLKLKNTSPINHITSVTQ